MRITLLESNRHFLQTTECALLSIAAHALVIGMAIARTAGGAVLPADEREARVFFLLPPDRVKEPATQSQDIQWGKLGGDIDDGRHSEADAEGWLTYHRAAVGQRHTTDRAGARGQLPTGPGVQFMDTVFSILQVDSAVQRFEWSGAPVYPPELLASGTEGVVYATFIVDTSGMVDTSSIRLLTSPHPQFSQSVRQALEVMRFRPAMRSGHRVRQLVEQHFRFTVTPPPAQVRQLSIHAPS